ncbi:NAD(P)H-dependent oxidoreductase [Arcanobacterium haemolyticum]|uniref:NADPH-dependent FMN reductase n=1 Tax=Arcanobacterium haemolyticum (strain ATCC 9345 / DSM 20595 / CCM 5947 / CCUG 17215 / LMG 16163 / NBRC 15585 / NCTC 8452 / 11018) TaxID=644284 RepID=D7BMI8_ARCHD|nr:NADPH-dependent FMN reductase [Arcanobacterium haemolyticum]ADH92137.1 NADPH-dependent FMN reductase [Arcanobacterium haemolyticum DSM 20595]QCX46299.1 NAD(P)H-dependent oxidoreductase [Arcanobacterium haemolyticum]SQH29158.1 Predicted flavoprotein [Arcanobacterium haemolyticum]
MTKKVSVLIGSLRAGSYARKIAHVAMEFFPADYDVQIVEIGNLPLYNFDCDDPNVPEVSVPAEWTAFRETIKNSDGILFVTPENNRLVPACLKNAVDIGSKPNSDVAWKNLPAGIISHSVGKMGGYSSQKTLRLALSYFDMPMPGQPEVFIGNSPELFDNNGMMTAESTREFIADYITRFTALIEKQ